MILFVGIGGLLLVAGVTETIRWRLAGARSNWVTLQDTRSGSVSIAKDAESFLSLLRSAPSPVWERQARDLPDVSVSPTSYASERLAGRIMDLPNGTHGEVVDRAEFGGQEFEPVTPGSATAKRGAGRFEVVEIRVRDGVFKGAVGWTLPEFMQHDVAWP